MVPGHALRVLPLVCLHVGAGGRLPLPCRHQVGFCPSGLQFCHQLLAQLLVQRCQLVLQAWSTQVERRCCHTCRSQYLFQSQEIQLLDDCIAIAGSSTALEHVKGGCQITQRLPAIAAAISKNDWPC